MLWTFFQKLLSKLIQNIITLSHSFATRLSNTTYYYTITDTSQFQITVPSSNTQKIDMKALNEDPVAAPHSSVGEQMGSAGTIFSTGSIKGKWHFLQSVVCISLESHINLCVIFCMQKTWFHGVEEVKKTLFYGPARWQINSVLSRGTLWLHIGETAFSSWV